ncbi:MAG: transglycosylase SLT domain-containing protein [Myxococcaceae bacterium]
MRWLFASITLILLASSPALAQLPDEDQTSLEQEVADPGFVRVANPAFPAPDVTPVADRGPKIDRSDLAPYFATGKLAEAKAAFDNGRNDLCRAALEGQPDTPPVRFLRAMAAQRMGDNAFASKEFEALATAWPRLKDRCLMYSGWSFEAQKDYDSAVRVYTAINDLSRQGLDGRLGLSRAYRGLKQWQKAGDALSPYLDRPAPPWGRDAGAEAWLAMADLDSFRGDRASERAALLKVWSAHPNSLAAKKAEGRLDPESLADVEALIVRGDTLSEGIHSGEAVALLEPVAAALTLSDYNAKKPDPKQLLACRAHLALGKALRKKRLHAKAIDVLAPVVKKCTADPDLRAKALYTLGFSRSVIGPRMAADTYLTLARDYPNHPLADDALFQAADSYEHGGMPDEALAALDQLATKYPDSENMAEGLFRKAWIWRARREPLKAVGPLEELEERFGDADESFEIERAQYWRGRLFEDVGEPKQAAEIFGKLAYDHPNTYYGLIAREKVAALDPDALPKLNASLAPAVETRDPFPVYAGPLGADPAFWSAVEMLRLGMGDQVTYEVLGIDRTQLPTDSVRLLVYLLALSGEERSAHGMARLWLRRDLSGRVTPANRAIWEIAYPNPYRDLILKHCESAAQLDPDLLQALMREESALDPKAYSWAGAIGLCQLMPATAAEVAGKLKLHRPSFNALLEPDLNIRLGAKYLSDLLGRAKGVKQYALAGYNAGEGAVARWRHDYGDSETDAWVENIPLNETRNYVKRVLRSYNTYRMLYGGGGASTTTAQR